MLETQRTSKDENDGSGLPDRHRLRRLLQMHQDWYRRLLTEPSFFTVIDSYPIELLLPIRQGRSPQQVEKCGKEKGCWSEGIKLCWLRNLQGQALDWDWARLNTHDQHFHPVIERYDGRTIVLGDWGFRYEKGIPANLKLCQKGTWNERMCVETARSMVTVVCDRQQHPPSAGSLYCGTSGRRCGDVQCLAQALSSASF